MTDPTFTLMGTALFGLSPSGSATVLRYGDFDGDGDLDVLVGNNNGDLQLFRNVGTPTSPSFTLVGTNPFGLADVGSFIVPALADIDGDGKLDVLVGERDTGNLFLFRNVGTSAAPSFTLEATNPFGLSGVGYKAAPVFVDLDGDDDLDLVVGQSSGLVVFENIGTATQPSFTLVGTNPYGLGNVQDYSTPVFADLDNDGDLDMLVGETNNSGAPYGSDIYFYRNVGTATQPSFTLAGTNPFGLTRGTASMIAPSLFDIDGDGDLDALVAQGSGTLSVYRNVAPPPPIPALQGAAVNGASLVLTYDLALSSTNPPAANLFTVTAGGQAVTVSSVAVDSVNKTVTLTLAQAVTNADTVTVSYTDPTAGNDTNAIQSVTGADAASFTAHPVTNNSPDTTPPSLVSASVNGTTLTLTYSETLDGAADAAGSAFTVMVNGVARTVTGADASGTTVTLTLGSAVERYQTVTVGYTPPGSGAKTQDVAGNAAASVTGGEVRNVTVGDANFILLGTNPFGLVDIGTSARPTLVDIDGDGDLDLVTGNSGASVRFYRNDGTTAEPSFTFIGTNPFGISNTPYGTPTFVDLDGDGDLDLLLGQGQGNTVVYRNVGTTTAPSFTMVGTNAFGIGQVGGGYAKATLWDLDGDGDLDVLFGGNDGSLTMYRNVGTTASPSFTVVGTNAFGLEDVGFASTPAFVDIDNDGDLDVLVGNFDGNTVVFRNIGTNAAPSFTVVGTNPYGLGDVGTAALPVFADLNGDGDLDALIGNGDGNFVVYLQGPPPPAAPSALALTAGTNTGSTADAITGNTAPTITGSAVPLSEVVLYDGASAIGTVTADSSGLWTLTTGTLAEGVHNLTAKATSAYYTGTSPASTALSVTIDTTAPTLTAAVLSGTQLTLTYSELLDGAQAPAGAFSVMVGGVARTVTAVASSGKTVTLTLDAGVVSVHQTVTVDYAPPGSGAKTADAAGNAAGALTGHGVTVPKDPNFVLEGTNPFGLVTTGPWSIPTFADIDGDGDLDALVGMGDGTIRFYRNDGTATAPSFTLAGTHPFGLGALDMNAAPTFVDIDGNGTLDALIGDFNGNTVVYRNVGTATAPTFTLVGTNPFGLSSVGSATTPSFVDIDGDGDLDALIGNYDGNMVFFRNIGTATAPSFTLESTNPFGLDDVGSYAQPTFVDVDGDGDLDALIGNFAGDMLFYRNVGSATAPSFTLEGTNPFGLSNVTFKSVPSIVDIDGDGDLDVLAGGDSIGNNIILFRNVPQPPASLALTPGSNSGSPADTLTNVTNPAISGQAQPLSTVVLYDGAVAVGTATADANGLWTITTTSLSEGAHSLTAVSSDATSTSPASSTLTVTIDSAAPNAPTVTTTLSNSTTPTLTGTAEADSTVTVTIGGATYTTTATNGSWSINLATATPTSGSLSLNANGTNAVSATATDAAGNVSSAGTQTLTIDTTAPNAPAVTSAALTKNATPTITGTAEAGSTVTVTVGGATYTTTATNGSWSINLATATPTSGSLSLNANGTNAVSATATDAAGNVSTAGTQTLTIDTTAPNAPAVTSAALTKNVTPIIGGTAEADSTVTVTVGGATYTTTATNGTWSLNLATATPTSGSLSLNANGTNAVSATATDAAGNTSTAGTQTLTIDTTAPNAPTVTTALSNSTTPTLTGAAETGSTVTVTVGGATYTTTATNGSWSINLAAATPTAGSLSLNANGTNTVSATATDAAGNTSTAGTQTLTIDTTAPNAPAVTSAALSNSATPIIGGTAETGSTVTVTVGGATYTTTATNGTWSLNLATATPTSGSLSLNANGTNAVSATATDAAGNVSTAGTQTLTIDTTAPNAPTVTTALSNSTTPTLTGTAETGSTVTVTIGGATYTATATNGNWSINLATATPTSGSLSLNPNGSNAVSATATDAAGNTSTAGTQTLTVDTTAPNAPTVTTALSNSTTPTLTGTAETGSTVTVTVGGATYTTTATNGNWSINLATATPTSGSLSLNPNGSNAVSATATDAAGNTSTAGTQTLTVDTTAPNAPTVTTALSNSTTPTLTGTAETGSTVTVTVGGATYTTTATNGTWSLNLATATPTSGSLSLNANGTNTVSATATDAAGNVSSAGTQTLTIDTTAPNAPAVTSA
ncbi:Ig-like domain-containing protein, partial [Azospirillum argentinense]